MDGVRQEQDKERRLLLGRGERDAHSRRRPRGRIHVGSDEAAARRRRGCLQGLPGDAGRDEEVDRPRRESPEAEPLPEARLRAEVERPKEHLDRERRGLSFPRGSGMGGRHGGGPVLSASIAGAGILFAAVAGDFSAGR